MKKQRKEANIHIGKRLREARRSLGKNQAEFAAAFGVSEEHYRKYESGATGLSADKILILHKKYGIDPTYLITGQNVQALDIEYYMVNSSREQRDALVVRVLSYVSDRIKQF